MDDSRYPYREVRANARRHSEYRYPEEGQERHTRKKERVKYTRQYDYTLLFLTLGIALFGVIMIYSAGYYTASLKNDPYRYVRTQLVSVLAGFGIMIIVSLFDYQILMQKFGGIKIRLVHILYFVALVLQTSVLVIGQDINGAKRWLKLGPISFQPSEISKIAVIVFIAYAIYQKRRSLDKLSGFVRIMVYVLPLILVILKENMSSAIIVAGIAFGMCFVASKKKLYFAGILAVGAAGLGAVLLLGKGFRISRIQMWLDVENHPGAFQIRQGLYAIASGGLFGKGLGESMQKLGFIPEAYNDMIFSVICEELGVVGAAVVIFAFLALFWRIVVIACHAPDLFGTMLCVGVMIQLAIQVIINIAVVTNTIPSTGIPLPLISYGGTSAVISMVEMGMVLGVSRQIKQK